MPAIPLPFIVSGCLLLVLVRMLRTRQSQPLFLMFVAGCAVQTALVGLRWSVDLGALRILQPVLAACLPPLAWAAFSSLRGEKAAWWHMLWPLVLILAWFLRPAAIDPLLIVEFLLYGFWILRLRLPDDVLAQVRIGDEWAVSQARHGVAGLLVLSACVDAAVWSVVSEGGSGGAAPVVAAMMSVMLIGLSGALLMRTADTVPQEHYQAAQIKEPVVFPDPKEAQAILASVEAALAKGLYRDPDLTLQRLARRTGLTARKISQAVNQARGCSVSDLVNGYRVREAMRLLKESDQTVTQVMLDAGFQTKSNFNRAFRAFAGQTPTVYRRSESG